MPRPITLLLLAFAVSCEDLPRSKGEERFPVHSVSEDGDTAVMFASDDPDMLRARRLARCTIGEFRRRLVSPPAGQTELMLKAAFRDDGETEHMWISIHRADGDSAFDGTLANDPASIRQLSYGDTVRVRTADVSDWFAIERDTLVAGFSMRVYDPRRPGGVHEKPKYVIDSEESALRRLRAAHCERT